MEFRELLNNLISKAAKWDSLGIQLGLSPDELDIIRANSQDVEECLQKVLQKWHRKNLNPTWQEIIAALRAMDEARFARELELKISGSSAEEPSTPDETPATIKKEITARIRGSFATLVKKVKSKLEKRDINMKDFRLYVVNLFPPGRIITDHDSVDDIFEIVSKNQLWDYNHCTPIEEIVGAFGGDDPELKKWISDYRTELAGFKATTKIVDFIETCRNEELDIADSDQTIRQNMARYDKSYCRKLTFKLKAKVTEKHLCYIDELWRSIADHFYIPCLSVLLDSIHEGCVEVTWCVPTLLALQIQTNIQDSTEFLQQHSIMRVIMDGEILYDEEGMDVKLLKACERGDVDEVVALLTYGIDVDTTDPRENGCTPLLVAARKGNANVIELLLRYNASIDKGDFMGYTPLLVAALNGHVLTVQILLANHADPNLATKDGWTALSCACYKGHLDIVKVLLLHEASVNGHSEANWTPLMHAIELKEENVEIVQLLLDAGATINYEKEALQGAWCPLALACDNGYFNIVKLLIERGADINVLGEDSEGFGWTPLMMAANRGYYKICELLLEHGSVVDLPQKGDGATPLIMACRKGTPELINLLMKYGASVHARCKNGVTAMHVVCKEGHLDMVKFLHAQGASIDTPSEKGCTPFMSACSGGHMDVVEYLVEQNASLLNIRTENGWSPLMFACDEGHAALVAKLLSLGASTEDYTDESGLSALIIAADRGHADVVKLLLENGAFVDYTEKSAGWSALFFAAKKGNRDIVKLLLKHEADVWLKVTSADVTAYDVASIEGQTDICDELEAHGYRSTAPPTDSMRREVERSMALTQNYLNVDNIRTFRDVLRHGYGHIQERRFGSDNEHTLSPSWKQDNM